LEYLGNVFNTIYFKFNFVVFEKGALVKFSNSAKDILYSRYRSEQSVYNISKTTRSQWGAEVRVVSPGNYVGNIFQ